MTGVRDIFWQQKREKCWKGKKEREWGKKMCIFSTADWFGDEPSWEVRADFVGSFHIFKLTICWQANLHWGDGLRNVYLSFFFSSFFFSFLFNQLFCFSTQSEIFNEHKDDFLYFPIVLFPYFFVSVVIHHQGFPTLTPILSASRRAQRKRNQQVYTLA